MNDFAGLNAIVTGGSSGIGAATARELLGRGARVAVLDRRIDGAPEGTYALEADVTASTAVQDAVARVGTELGGIDILVNNAGVGAAGDVTENDEDEWRRVLDVNVIGIARLSRAALP